MKNKFGALYEYLGVISPNEIVHRKVKTLKERCKNNYAWDLATVSKPHFTVLNIVQHISYHEKFVKCLARNSKNISPFRIDLNGFDYFPGEVCTLYVKLKDVKDFCRMAQYLKKKSRYVVKSFEGQPPHFVTTKPHLTVAKGILNSEFMPIWKDWENAAFEATTNATCLTLLRRPFSMKMHKYEVVGEYQFLGNGNLEDQLELFNTPFLH